MKMPLLLVHGLAGLVLVFLLMDPGRPLRLIFALLAAAVLRCTPTCSGAGGRGEGGRVGCPRRQRWLTA